MKQSIKTSIKICFFVVMGLFLITISNVNAATTNSAVVTFTIYNTGTVSVSNITGDVDLSSMVANTTNLFCSNPTNNTIRIIFRNNGTGEEDFEIRGEVTSGGVSLISGGLGAPAPVINEVRLLLAFADWTSPYTHTDYDTGDALTSSYGTCSATAFAVNSDPDDKKGFDVPYSGDGKDRNMRFCVEPGKIGTGADGENEDITVRVWVKANAS